MPLHASSQRSPIDLRGSVIYQIFLDRFANGDPATNPANVAAWGSRPTKKGFMGGDLRGVTGKLGYLEELGVDVLYLTPIFHSSSNHRYNTYDYYRIDPRLGTLGDFHRLIDEAHRRRMRVFLDGVFGHCGRGFYPFFDVMENGADSPYCDWFSIGALPVDAYARHRYRAFQDSPVVPHLNLSNAEASSYMLRVAEHWTHQGIDGWRLDAVPHVHHRPFWEELRQTVKEVNPGAFLLAEVWEDIDGWLDTGHFDGVTNYAFWGILRDFLTRRSYPATEFARRLEELAAKHSWAPPRTLCNLIGSHDTVRIRTEAGNDLDLVRLAYLLLFAYPGLPAVYYGDEIGLEGGEDPDNRRAMEWDPSCWNSELRDYVKRLIALRRSLVPLQSGNWLTMLTDDARNVCAILRRVDEEFAILFVNGGFSTAPVSLDLRPWGLPVSEPLVDCLSRQQYRCDGGELALPPLSGALLTKP